jgi:hypothetical protein
LQAYHIGAEKQPDKTLLVLEAKQREDWLTSGGVLDPATFFGSHALVVESAKRA